MAKIRSWSGEEAIVDPSAEANNGQFVESVIGAGIQLRTSVTEAIEQFGGTRALAEKLVEMGFSSGKNPVRNMQRNLQRYSQYERSGKKSTNARPAPEGIQRAINKASREDAIQKKQEEGGGGIAGADGTHTISLRGKITVNGYKRDRHIKEIFMDDDDFYDFLDDLAEGEFDSAWDRLADAYDVKELHGIDFEMDFN